MAGNFFEELSKNFAKAHSYRVVIPLAANEAVKFAISKALSKGFINKALLIGDSAEIKSVFKDLANDERICIIQAASEAEALNKAIEAIKANQADIIMKGMVQSSSLIKAVLDKKNGLQHGFINHLTCFQLPNKDGLRILTDPAVNIAPDADTICKEIENATEYFNKLVNRAPIVALMAANEKVSEKMPATVIGKSVTDKMADRKDMIVEGPVAFDLAVCPKSAQIKKYNGKIQGNADIFVTTQIETANALYKSLQHIIHADMGGLLYGAQCPVIHPSRADNGETKYNSLLLGIALLEVNSKPR